MGKLEHRPWPRRPLTIAHQVLITFAGLSALVSIVVSLILYTMQSQTLLAGIDAKLYAVAALAHDLLPPDYHDRIAGPDSVSDAEFLGIVDRYNRLCQALDLEYIWSLMLVDNEIVFTTGTSPDKVAANRQQASFFQVHSNPELYVPTFARMTPTYQDSHDRWGPIRAVLIPNRDRQGRPYLFGASISLARVDAQLIHLAWQCVAGSLLLFVVMLAAGLLLARSIARPLRRLVTTIQELAEGRSEATEEKAGSYEQVVLAGTFRRLLRSLQDKVAESTERETDLRITLDAIGDAVVTVNVAGEITRMNPVAEVLTGWSLVEAAGKPLAEVFRIINAVTREPAECPVERVMRQGTVVGLANDTALIDRAGREYQIADSAAPVFDGHGRMRGIVLVFHDMTEQYRARRALEESERQFRALYENMTEGVALHQVLCDARGVPTDYKILDVNPAFAKCTGLDAATAKGRLASEVYGVGVAPYLQEYARVAQTGEPFFFEIYFAPMSKYFDISVVCPKPGYFATVFQDVTEQKRNESMLKTSEERFRTLFDKAPVGVVISRSDRILHANQMFVQMFGYPGLTELGGSSLSRLFSESGALVAHDSDIKDPGAVPPRALETAGLRRDGSQLPLAIEVAEIELPDGPARVWFCTDITERRQAEERTRTQMEHLEALHAIDVTINNSLDLDLVLEEVLGQSIKQLGADAADVLLLNDQTLMLEYAHGCGFRLPSPRFVRIRLGQGHAGLAAMERRVVVISDLALAPGAPIRAAMMAGEGFCSYVSVPLVAKGEIKGVLELFHRAPFSPDPEWMGFLHALADQTAIAVDNMSLLTHLQRSTEELDLAYEATLEGWSRALDLRDRETEGHTQRVAQVTLDLARSLGLRDDDLLQVHRGALLHDIGKMGIPDSILLKPGPLTAEEWVLMRKHPQYAHDLLWPIAFLRPALDIPYCHHEKWDGTGYPRGLRGAEIPLAARAFAIVDVWDALRSDRPYRPAWPADKVRAWLDQQAGAHLDPQIVGLFLKA